MKHCCQFFKDTATAQPEVNPEQDTIYILTVSDTGNICQSNTDRVLVSVIDCDTIPFIGKLYPNPNEGKFTLDYRLGALQEGELIIYNIAGQKVSSYKLNHDKKKLEITETLSNGIYPYRIFINEGIALFGKVVVIR